MKKKLLFIVILLVITIASVSADYYYYDRVPTFTLAGNITGGANLKYFPYAEKSIGKDKAWYHTFKNVSLGVDAAYIFGGHFGVGADINAHFMDYRKYIQSGRFHLGVEMFADIRVVFGREKGRESGIPVFSAALLGGGAMYTNFGFVNFVPGAGVKLMFDFYSRDGFMWGFIVRGTGFLFQHKNEAYTVYDMNVSVGVRFGLGIIN